MGLFTMKDRMEMLQRNISVAYNCAKYNYRYNQANRRVEKAWKEMVKSGRFYGNEYDVVRGLEEDLINPESIYDLISQAFDQCGVSAIKNEETEQKLNTYVRDHSVREIIRFIYMTIIYCQDGRPDLIEGTEIDNWIDLMTWSYSWSVLSDFDNHFPGKVSLTELTKEINGILYQYYPEFDERCIENRYEDEKLPFSNHISKDLFAEIGAVLIQLVGEKYGDPESGDDSGDEYDDIQEVYKNRVAKIRAVNSMEAETD